MVLVLAALLPDLEMPSVGASLVSFLNLIPSLDVARSVFVIQTAKEDSFAKLVNVWKSQTLVILLPVDLVLSAQSHRQAMPFVVAKPDSSPTLIQSRAANRNVSLTRIVREATSAKTRSV